MEAELTKEERGAISSLRRLAKRWPETLNLYVLDGDYLYVCKKGVPSDEICEEVHFGVSPGCVLTDMHDDMDNGQA